MKKWLTGLGFAAILPACVTINIYFPAAAAEKAADKVIEEVWQLKDAQTKPGGNTANEKPAQKAIEYTPSEDAPAEKPPAAKDSSAKPSAKPSKPK